MMRTNFLCAKIFVIAGSKEQATVFMLQNKLPLEMLCYVEKEEQLRYVNGFGCTMFIIGTAAERPNFKILEELAKTCKFSFHYILQVTKDAVLKFNDV